MHGTRGLALPAVLALSLMTAAGVHAFLRKPANLKNTRPEMWMSTPQLIKTNGLEPETHTVKTEDGYILVAHRIAHGRRSNATNPTPVLMGHGLCSSDEQWVFRGKDQHNLVYTLADMGFDVWLANYRGSFYSRRHATLDAKSHEFWDFSWHENGVYDQSALIDYVLKVTGKESLIVLGHSMSSTSQLVLLAERPEYSGKVRASILLAPPAYFAHASGFLGIVNILFKSMPFLRDATSQNLINDKFSGLDRPFPQACLDRIGKINARMEPFCSRLFEQALGKMHTPIDMDLLRLVLHHYPAGSSIRQVMHYAQCIDAGGRFIKYDFGPEKNREKYGVPFAPEYNLSRIASPLYLHYSVGDGTVNYKDVEAFARNLSPGVLKKLRKIPSDTFNHVDYLIASDVNELLYKDVIEDLLKHV